MISRHLGLGGFVLAAVLAAGGPAAAVTFTGVDIGGLGLGREITIADRMGAGAGWHGAQEDNEVEPGCSPGQIWDLEGVFLQGSRLTLLGGFDFAAGVKDGDRTIRSGDLFLDVDGDAQYGPVIGQSGGSDKNPLVQRTFGYDYAVVFDFANEAYSVYDLTPASSVWVSEVFYKENAESNPWRYGKGGNLVSAGTELLLYRDLRGVPFEGDKKSSRHDALVVDLSFLGHGAEFTSHFTMQCGNDNLMGRGVVAPEPSSMLLLGTGLIGAARICRRKRLES